MDFFGIGSAIKASVRMYSQMARQTGRTTQLLNALQDGDAVITWSQDEAKRMDMLLRRMRPGLKVSFRVMDKDQGPYDAVRLFHGGIPEGRVYFDHMLVERFYSNAIDETERLIDDIQRGLGKELHARSGAMRDQSRARFDKY